MFETILAAESGTEIKDLGWIVMVVGSLVFGLACIIIDAWRKSSETKAREESRRELAAYVAEGSMSAQDAALLMSDRKKGHKVQVTEATAKTT
jgi:hypothetical protein